MSPPIRRLTTSILQKQECALSFQASKMVKQAPNRGQFLVKQVHDAISSCTAVYKSRIRRLYKAGPARLVILKLAWVPSIDVVLHALETGLT